MSSPTKRLSAEELAKLDGVEIDGPALNEKQLASSFAKLDMTALAADIEAENASQASPRVTRGRRRDV